MSRNHYSTYKQQIPSNQYPNHAGINSIKNPAIKFIMPTKRIESIALVSLYTMYSAIYLNFFVFLGSVQNIDQHQ